MSQETRRDLTRLGSHDPFVLSTRDLGHRPGAMRTESRTVAAPADLRLEMIGVPEGADVQLDIRLEAVMEGVLVSGTARVPLVGECARCLDSLTSHLEVDFQELFVYPGSQEAEEDEPRLEGEMIDLEPVFRDAVVLALPMSPLCREDCPGLCPQCGVRLLDADPGHHHDVADPRWAALRGLLDENTTEDDQGS